MSIIPKLQSAMCAVFILATVGAISVLGQAQRASENSLISSNPSATSTNESKKVETKPSSVTAESTAQSQPADVSTDNSNSTAVKGASMAPAATEKTTVPQATPADEDKWDLQFRPYFWMASLNGTTGTTNRNVQVNESFSEIFDSLNFVFMGFFEARKGRFISLTDLEYISISDEKATAGPLFSDVKADIKTFIFIPQIGYRVYHKPEKGTSVHVVGGAMIWRISTDLTLAPGILPGTQIKVRETWVDATGGLRVSTNLSKKLFVNGKFDVGGGGSKFTYQLFGGGGYSITKKFSLLFGYRVIDVNYDKNNFVYDMNQRGPVVGIGFNF